MRSYLSILTCSPNPGRTLNFLLPNVILVGVTCDSYMHICIMHARMRTRARARVSHIEMCMIAMAVLSM